MQLDTNFTSFLHLHFLNIITGSFASLVGSFFQKKVSYNGVHFTNCWFCSNDQVGTSFSFISKLLRNNSQKLVTYWLLQLKSLKLTSEIEGYCQYWKLFSQFLRKLLSFHLLAIFCLGYQLEEISMTPIIIFLNFYLVRLVASFMRAVRIPTGRPRMYREAIYCWNATFT